MRKSIRISPEAPAYAGRKDTGRQEISEELHLQFLAPQTLSSDELVGVAVHEVECALTLRGPDVVLDACLSRPYSLELLLCGMFLWFSMGLR